MTPIKETTLHFTLKSGQKVIWTPNPDNQQFHLGMYFNIGSSHEPKKLSGISHFIEHMIFRGSRKYPSVMLLAQAFEIHGGEWNAATGYEHTEFTYSGVWRKHQEIIPLFIEFISNPVFLDIEKERQVILREIDDELNEFDNSSDLGHQILKITAPESPLALPITGSKQSIANISTRDLINYWQNSYLQSESVFYISGGDPSYPLKDLLEKNFSQTKKPTIKKKSSNFDFKGPKCKIIEDGNNQYQAQISFVCDPNPEKDPIYSVLSYLLTDGFTSYLTLELRENLGLVYDVSSSYQSFENQALFTITFQAPNNLTKKVIEKTLAVLHKIKTKQVDPKDLSKAINRYCVDIELSQFDQEYLSYFLAKKEFFPKNLSLKKLYTKAQEITGSDIKETAQKIFTSENTAVCLLGEQNNSLQEQVVKLL
jgi:predicted Zn-dependent peptidase